jgi:hypothetical protein
LQLRRNDLNPPRTPGATQGPGALTPLERRVLEALVSGPGAEALRAQLGMASSAGRTWSGVGFVLRIALPAEAPAASPSVRPRPVTATHQMLREPAEFILSLKNGRLAVLEGFCHVGGWPADDEGFRVVPTRGPQVT